MTVAAVISPAIDMSSAAAIREPFAHSVVPNCLAHEPGLELLAWLETFAPWRLVRADFYEQSEFSLWDTDAPAAAPFVASGLLGQLRNAMTGLFRVAFEPAVSIVAHKLEVGQRIAIHNDLLKGAETHRLVVQLNRGLADADGGFLMLFNSDDAKDVYQILRPVHGSGLAFEISDRSFHAVSRMNANVRYTLVYSFRAEAH